MTEQRGSEEEGRREVVLQTSLTWKLEEDARSEGYRQPWKLERTRYLVFPGASRRSQP